MTQLELVNQTEIETAKAIKNLFKKKQPKKETTTKFSESSKGVWGIFNGKTNLRVSNIETKIFEKTVSVGSTFDTREAARAVKKLLVEQYPRRTFVIKKLEVVEIVDNSKEEN